MTAPNQRVDTVAHVLTLLAVDITRALEHAQRELAQADVWPSDTLPEHTSGGTPGASPIESERLLAAYEMRSTREDLRDWITGLEDYTRSGSRLADRLLRARLPGSELFDATDYGKRCAGKADPTCTNWATEHRSPANPSLTTDDWCDRCWRDLACQVCGRREREQRRVGGVPACGACAKADQRSRTKASAA